MAKVNVLVIEDDEDILELMVHNLSKDGFMVKGALSGEDGLAKLKSEQFDCVVLDLMLPGIDGLDVCRSIRQNSATLTKWP